MTNEAHYLGETLIFTPNLVARSNAVDRARINCAAYDVGLQLIGEIFHQWQYQMSSCKRNLLLLVCAT